MFESMMKEILVQVGGLSSQNTELCTLLRNILQVLLLLLIWLLLCKAVYFKVGPLACCEFMLCIMCNVWLLAKKKTYSHFAPNQHFNILLSAFQAMMQIIDALSTCVRHVGSFEEVPVLDTIRSLPTCILKVLRETFHHCKVSLFSSLIVEGTFDLPVCRSWFYLSLIMQSVSISSAV